MSITDNTEATPEEKLHSWLTLICRLLAGGVVGALLINYVFAAIRVGYGKAPGPMIDQTSLNVLAACLVPLWVYFAVLTFRARRNLPPTRQDS